MWKTITVDVGKKHGLDGHNAEAYVKVIPMLWLPGKTSAEVMSAMSMAEKAVAESGKAEEDPETIRLRVDSLLTVLPNIVASWNFKDPETGEAMPTPREQRASGNVSALELLPMQILNDIVNESVNFGMEEDEPKAAIEAGAVDPDAGDSTAKVIPFENVAPSVTPSSVEAAQDEPLRSSGS